MSNNDRTTAAAAATMTTRSTSTYRYDDDDDYVMDVSVYSALGCVVYVALRTNHSTAMLLCAVSREGWNVQKAVQCATCSAESKSKLFRRSRLHTSTHKQNLLAESQGAVLNTSRPLCVLHPLLPTTILQGSIVAAKTPPH